MHGDKEETGMRLFSGLLVSTLAVGTIMATGCAEHRYRGNDPYYGSSRYYGQNDPYYRQWLAERRYNYVEYNRLNRARQQEYWNWRRQNEARFRNDPRFRDNRNVRNERNDHDADDRRRNDHDADDRRRDGGRQVARDRDGDRDRHKADRDRHQVRKDHDKDRDRDRDRDRDHD